jgi:hypothetical protein
LFGSLLSSTHACPQSWALPAHAVVQCPVEQTWPAAHALPHAPQFFGSLAVFTHDAPHLVSPEVHAQAPPEQTPPLPQLTPQAPQLLGSLLSLTHD